jgi:DNA-binding SARP family transcriptional activator
VADERGLRIRLLGNLAASYDGVAVDLGGPQQRAVLAMLVLYRDRGLSDDRIVEYLWDDQPPARALPTLQAYISHLRRRLEPQAAAGSRSGVIVRQGRGYAVRLPVDAVDAWRFEQLLAPVNDDAERVRRLTEALALWRGTPLAEYAHLGWAQAEISRLEEMRSVAASWSPLLGWIVVTPP